MNLEVVDLPEGYVPVTNLQQLFKLRKGKRARLPENLVRDNQQIIYLYSEVEDGYYKRLLQPYTLDEDLQSYINRGVLFYKPKE